MSRSPLPSLEEDHDYSNLGIMHSLVEWVYANKKNILVIFASLVIGIILAYRLLTYRSTNAEGDFLRADTLFAHIKQNTPFAENSPIFADLQELQTLMQRHTDLKAKYDGALAQLLLISNQAGLAYPLLNDVFTRISPDHLQLYQAYSTTSLLITEGRYQEALTNAEQLQVTLTQTGHNQEHPLLYIFNVMRLGALYRELKQPDQELNIWREFQHAAIAPDILTSINDTFKSGRLSVNEYIQSR